MPRIDQWAQVCVPWRFQTTFLHRCNLLAILKPDTDLLSCQWFNRRGLDVRQLRYVHSCGFPGWSHPLLWVIVFIADGRFLDFLNLGLTAWESDVIFGRLRRNGDVNLLFACLTARAQHKVDLHEGVAPTRLKAKT